ncbi:MAG TPA: oxygen-independent coproporphyrinogen III oxidase [Steroidobacteraceae bacterium]|nr:oxygen-independent coproporphyrinogen III oxidase [Steroidobacteraceae bacterium]
MGAATVAFDTEIMCRYDREGPRYTSYPTAAQFRETIGASDYRREALHSRGARAAAPLSLYVHIPFCYAPCFYCGCNKMVTSRLELADAYCTSLGREISLRGACFGGRRSVEQMHFGGGTPTFLPTRRLIELVDRIDREFPLTSAQSRDYSIEIDPRGADPTLLRMLASLGFNRLSLGVQDFDPAVQRAVNRVQAAELVERTYHAAREIGFRSINFDLIYGLPLQTPSSFAATLERVAALRPDRIAVYGYAHMPHLFKAQRRIRREQLPDAAARLRLLEIAVASLSAAGYLYIGMDHFALPSDSLAQALEARTLQRSFQGYTTHADLDLVNLGVSAIGKVGELYVQNHKLLADYERTVAGGALPTQRGVRMSRDDLVRKDVIHAIMCHGSVDTAAIERASGIRFDAYFAPELERLKTLQADGLVALEDGRIDLTPVGRLLMRNVAMTFDAYAARGAEPLRASRLI